jgi:hypothetical protein
MNYHFMVKVVQAKAMAGGFLPLVDLQRAGGQPLVGNPNNVALYPDNLLYLVASSLWALNAHLWIHLLLAPVAAYSMARAWGLERSAAWACGFLYGTSGFLLSQLNLYNMIGVSALAPALVAACLTTTGGGRGERDGARGERGAGRETRGAGVAGLCWCLLLLAGEPLLAALAMLAGLSASATRGGATRRSWAVLAGGLSLGTAMAAPQLVELARIFGSSYRGGLGFSYASRLVGSWHPRELVEWLVPLFFGKPDFAYWGSRLPGADPQPLLYSLYPGLLALALVGTLRRPRARVELWSWGAVGVGIFVALGGSNPLMGLLLRLPMASLLRSPVKWFLLVALGGSLLAGLSFERWAAGKDRARSLSPLVGLAVVAGLAWLLLWLHPEWLALRLESVLPPGLAAEEMLRWRGSLLVSLVLLGAYAAIVWRANVARPWVAAAAVWLHVASQLFLLRPLADTDEAAAYSLPPRVLAHIEAGERVVQGCAINFACGESRRDAFPDRRLAWLQRRGWSELFPFAGVNFDVAYSFNPSPEGLDSFLPATVPRALPQLKDREVVQLLAASSVDVLLISRPLAEQALEGVRLRAEMPTFGSRLWVYEIVEAAESVRLVGRVRSGDLAEVMRRIVAVDFDPRNEVYLPDRPEGATEGRGGVVRPLPGGRERWAWQTEAPDPGLLVLDRSHLPIYRASVDGEARRPLVVNVGQLGIEVPAGSHHVGLWVDRRPFRVALAVAGLGLLGLVALAAVGARRHDSTGPTRRGSGESPL